ncbi:MAG: MBL fold metallo-hydrolase, partial [Deinococcales bacterium]|nr:MBL fold metallo-hydrolase [Chitinophagaceae bacterium]
MQRRSFLRNTSFSAALLALSPKELLANFLQQPGYKITMLRNDVGIFTERGGTIAFHLSKKGIVVVDSQFAEPAKHVIDELKKKSEKPFSLLINTHHHGDHTGGNIAFKDVVGNVVGHANCLANYKRVAAQQKNEDKQLFQDITFTDTWKRKMGNEKIKAHYFGAAHTNGDSIIHFEHANIAHMGDLLFNRRYPAIDRTAGANLKNWATVLDKTLSTFSDETLFIAGHAFDPEKVVCTKDDVKVFKDYLEKLVLFVDGEIKTGKTKDEIIKNKT